MRLGAGILACLLLLAAACGGDDESSATATASGAAQTTAAATASASATATKTATPAPGGPELVLDVPAEGGAVALAAGSYRTGRFQPEAHLAVPDGWSAAFDTARFVELFRGADAAANCFCLINPDGVFYPDGAQRPLPDDLVTWLTTNTKLQTSSPSSLQVGNLSGRQLDVEVAAGASGKVDYLAAGDQRFSVKAGERQHLIVLTFRDRPLIIAQRSPAAEYSDYFVYTEQVVGGLSFAN